MVVGDLGEMQEGISITKDARDQGRQDRGRRTRQLVGKKTVT